MSNLRPANEDEVRARPPRIAAVILAAGLSSRMTLGPKLLLPIAGAPMICRTARNVLGVSPVEVVAVTGFHAAEVEAALGGLPIRSVHNANYRDGQPTSVALAVPLASRSLRRGHGDARRPAADDAWPFACPGRRLRGFARQIHPRAPPPWRSRQSRGVLGQAHPVDQCGRFGARPPKPRRNSAG